jgi:nitronate monooxygenase
VTIATRLTKRFGIKHPIVLAPMTPASGGALASAVAAAGGLGLLGGGYVDRVWYEAQSAKVTRPDVGAGFITWTIPADPGLLDVALERHPRAMMLAFSDPGPYAARIKKAGVPLICQVHTLDHAFRAVDVGADVVVAQGTEAGGHGWAVRSTMPFVPSVVDALAARAPEILVLAAGGIADGRGLAASLMLGADGVLMGTRFWATQEALIPERQRQRCWRRPGTRPSAQAFTTSCAEETGRQAIPVGSCGTTLSRMARSRERTRTSAQRGIA